MISIPQSQNEIVVELEQNEKFEPHVLTATVNQIAANPSIWNIHFVVSPEIGNANAEFLRENRFIVAGFVSKDNVTFLKLLKKIRTSGEAGGTSTLAVAEPLLPRSQAECAAIELMVRRHGPRSEAA